MDIYYWKAKKSALGVGLSQDETNKAAEDAATDIIIIIIIIATIKVSAPVLNPLMEYLLIA